MAAVLGVLTATTCATAITFAAATIFRRFVPARISCWCCCAINRVAYASRNGWVCSACSQYNGFDANGLCNNAEVLAAMHGTESDADSINSTRLAVAAKGSNVGKEAVNGLCQQCNINQKLKITQLGMFEPKSPTTFHSEVEDYTRHLESTYRLCRKCEAFVHQKIGEQDAWLKPKVLTWRLEKNRSSFTTSATGPSSCEDGLAFKVFLVLASLVICAHANGFDTFPASGGFSEAVATVMLLFLFNTLQAGRNSSSKLACLSSWALLFLACTLRRYIEGLAAPAKSATPGLSVLCLATSSAFLLARSGRSDKPLKSQSKSRTVYANEALHSSTKGNESSISDSLNQSCAEISYNDCMQIPDHEVHFGSRSNSALELAVDKSSTASGRRCDISALHIGDEGEPRPQSPSAFSLKQYATSNTSGIDFGSGQTSPSRRILLQPARFEPKHAPVAKASWVAGGYWQTQSAKLAALGMSGELSRSSSQSSGFISYSAEQQLSAAFNSLPNTRVNSVFGDAERSSVLSEPIYGGSKSVYERPQARDSCSVASSAERESVLCPSQAHSSGLPRPSRGDSPAKAMSLLDRHINIRISLYSLLLAVSIACNVSLALYWATSQTGN